MVLMMMMTMPSSSVHLIVIARQLYTKYQNVGYNAQDDYNDDDDDDKEEV